MAPKTSVEVDDTTRVLFDDVMEDVEHEETEDHTVINMPADDEDDDEQTYGEEAEPSDAADAAEEENSLDETPSLEEGEAGEGSEDDDSTQDEESEENSPANAKLDPKDGLLKDLIRERREKAELKAQLNAIEQQRAAAPQVPVAPAPSETTAHQQAMSKGIPVVVSADGTDVHVDPAAFDAEVQRLVGERVSQAMQPSPMQLAQEANLRVEQEFVGGDAARAEVVERAKTADQYVALRIQELKNLGHDISTPAQGLMAMRAMGVDKEVEQHFPDIAPILDEFVEGMSSGNSMFRRMVLEKLVKPVDPAGGTEQDGPALKSVANMPKSMTKKGGNRSQPPTGDQAEYDSLYKSFEKNIGSFPRDKFERMKQLGRALGVEGADDM